MKVEWKASSMLDSANEQLLHLKVRTESDFVVSRVQLQKLRSALRRHAEFDSTFLETDLEDWEANFGMLEAIFSAYSDVPEPIRRIRLETPWKAWETRKFRDIERMMIADLSSAAFISIAGEPPNLQLSLRVGTTHLLNALSHAECEGDRRFFASLTEVDLQKAADDVKAGITIPREAVIALGTVALAGGIIAVSIGGTTLGAILISALAAETITAAQAIAIFTAVGGILGGAAKIYEHANEQERLRLQRLEIEAEKVRQQIIEALDQARRESMIALNYEDGKYGGYV
jgi:hypothetical protein